MKKLPYPIQQTYSRDGWYQNTPVSVPAPPPSNLPAPCWIGGSVRTSWTNNRAMMPPPVQTLFDDGKINWFAEWSSPIFDLKPMLQGYTGNGRSGNNNTTQRAMAVWVGGGTGMGGKLFCQVEIRTDAAEFTDTSNFDGVMVETYESGHVSDPGKVNRISSVQDVTANFSLDGSKYIVLGFLPFGEGLPIRYWKQTLWFMKYEKDGATPAPFTLQGAFY